MVKNKNKIHPGGWSNNYEGGGGGRKLPNGVPINVVVKVGQVNESKKKKKKDVSSSSSDIRFSSNKISITDEQSGGGDFDLDFVYGMDAKFTDIMDRSVGPLIKAFCEGVSITILSFGTCSSERALVTEKLLPMTLQGIFSVLSKSNKAGGAGAGGKRSRQQGSAAPYSITVRAYEIYDEIIQDLFNAENRNLRITHDSIEGNVVSQCSVRGPYSNVEDALDVIVDSFNARTSGMSDFGPTSRHTTTVWQFDLTQFVHRGGQMPHHVNSKLLFVDLAGTEKLSEDRNAVRAREGPTLGKSLLALQSVSESFQRGEHDYAPLSESKLTQLLQDSLCANSITLCVGSVVQGESELSAATVQLGAKLRKGYTYPTINDERVQGLIRHYRVHINRLRDELHVANSRSKRGGNGNSENGENDQDLQEMTLKVNELEGKIVKDNLEKLRLKEEREKIYGKLVEFREKYNELVEQKSHIQSTTIKGEEEKLKLSKALLDLRIENNKLIERCEAEKYELVTKLLNAENEILQYEMKEETREKNTTTLKKKLEDAQHSAEEHKQDLLQLKDNYVRIEAQFKEELQKNEELGVELLTLVNQKNSLMQEAEELRKERSKLLQDSKVVDEKQVTLISEKAELEEALITERKAMEQLKSENMKLQLESQRRQVEFQTEKLDLEKQAADINRERDSEVTQLKNKIEMEGKRNETIHKTLEAEIKKNQTALKLSTRKIKEYEDLISERNEQVNILKTENASLIEKLNSTTEGYRKKLMELLNPTHSTSGQDEDGIDRSDTPDSIEREQELLQKELVDTFRTRESELEKKLKELELTNLKIVEKNRLLLSRYTSCKYKLEDLQVDVDRIETSNPSGAQKQNGNSVEDDESLFKVASSQIEDQLRKDVANLKERLDRTAYDLQQSQEKNIKIAAQVKTMTRENELRLGELQSEVKLLERQKANLEEENHVLSQRGGAVNGKLDEETSKRMQEVQNNLLAKIEELQRTTQQQLQSPGNMMGGFPQQQQQQQQQQQIPFLDNNRISELQARNRELEQQVNTYKDQLEQTRSMQSPFPNNADNEVQRLKEENQKLRQLYSRRATNAMASPGGNNNKDYGDLLTRCTVAEEELANYKAYMKKALAKAQQDIKQLKTERDMWKQKAGG